MKDDPLPLSGIPLKGESFGVLKMKFTRWQKRTPLQGGRGQKDRTVGLETKKWNSVWGAKGTGRMLVIKRQQLN